MSTAEEGVGEEKNINQYQNFSLVDVSNSHLQTYLHLDPNQDVFIAMSAHY